MDCSFSLNPLFHGKEITSWNRQSLNALTGAQRQNMTTIIDTMGARSAKAQALPSIITTMSKMVSSDHTIYICTSPTQVLGILKMGKKHLFIRNKSGAIVEITPLCCLDFYVHESCQRGGIGHKLFQRCVADTNVQPKKIAYDRPSPKLISFLRKHYNLVSYVPQNNNFVVFDDYFEDTGFRGDTGRDRRYPFEGEEDTLTFGSSRRRPGPYTVTRTAVRTTQSATVTTKPPSPTAGSSSVGTTSRQSVRSVRTAASRSSRGDGDEEDVVDPRTLPPIIIHPPSLITAPLRRVQTSGGPLTPEEEEAVAKEAAVIEANECAARAEQAREDARRSRKPAQIFSNYDQSESDEDDARAAPDPRARGPRPPPASPQRSDIDATAERLSALTVGSQEPRRIERRGVGRGGGSQDGPRAGSSSGTRATGSDSDETGGHGPSVGAGKSQFGFAQPREAPRLGTRPRIMGQRSQAYGAGGADRDAANTTPPSTSPEADAGQRGEFVHPLGGPSKPAERSSAASFSRFTTTTGSTYVGTPASTLRSLRSPGYTATSVRVEEKSTPSTSQRPADKTGPGASSAANEAAAGQPPRGSSAATTPSTTQRKPPYLSSPFAVDAAYQNPFQAHDTQRASTRGYSRY